MKEVKTPKKPLAYYYGIVLIVLIVFNLVVTPILMEHQVKETDYGTFMSMIEKKNIGEVEVKDNQIIFTDKDQKNIYKTGLMNDPNLTDRLYECGAVFAKDIDKQMSPIISFLLTGVLPLILFIALGNYMAKKLMEHAGGKNSMAFGMGKSNAKIYVQSSEGIRFSDVAGEDEAKENLSEIVDYLHNPKKYTDVGASMPKGVLLVGPPGTGKTMLAKAVAGESNVPFFSMSGSEFVEMFVGMGASKVRDLFGQAFLPIAIWLRMWSVKNVTSNEPFFTGHFPEEPVMPGVLQVEAMAQCGGLLVLNQLEEPERWSTYFMKLDDVKFRKKVVPGDTLLFRVELLAPVRHGISSMKGYMFVGDQVVAEATFTAQIVKNK